MNTLEKEAEAELQDKMATAIFEVDTKDKDQTLAVKNLCQAYLSLSQALLTKYAPRKGHYAP